MRGQDMWVTDPVVGGRGGGNNRSIAKQIQMGCSCKQNDE